MNKIDNLISDDDDILDTIENQKKFLISKGFKNPIICPTSSRAVYLAKKLQQGELNQIEHFEIQNIINKFKQNSLKKYYETQFNYVNLKNSDDEITNLLKNCGFSYLEQIINYFKNNGGKIHGSSLC